MEGPVRPLGPLPLRPRRRHRRRLRLPGGRTRRRLTTRPEIVAELHAAGISVNVRTVNDPARRQALTDPGVDGIITDRATGMAGAPPSAAHAPPRSRTRRPPRHGTPLKSLDLDQSRGSTVVTSP
ncbi:glycerophosphodiester phosphodiesterase family protein [Streptomyces filamentosus]|uniref:glycerophosphodiester phosphodiesterase family protein n=1 Tax=Streptomyces filamentosus TaxID=67294 RepID=UPI00307FA84F